MGTRNTQKNRPNHWVYISWHQTPQKTSFWYDDIFKWKHFPRYWPFVRRIHGSRVDYPHKGQWSGPLVFSLIRAWTNGRANNRDAGDLRRHCAHYGVTYLSWILYYLLLQRYRKFFGLIRWIDYEIIRRKLNRLGDNEVGYRVCRNASRCLLATFTLVPFNQERGCTNLKIG